MKKETRGMQQAFALSLFASLGLLSACGGGGGGAAPAGGAASTATVNDVGGKAVTFSSSAGTIQALTLVAAPAGAAKTGLDFPNGFFSYKVTGLTNGQQVTVTVTLPVGTAPTQVTKCIAAACADLVVAGKASIAANVITLTLKDGDAATDADGAADGTITDPFGPGLTLANNKLSGSTEPLYTYQWALKKATSYFSTLTGINFTANDGLDLNVEAAHTGSYSGNDGKPVKGTGVNVLVLDDGIDIRNEDLMERVDVAQTRNFDFLSTDTTASEFGHFRSNAMNAKDDPTPVTTKAGQAVNQGSAHGTNVAGIILASQNGKGVMGIAPRATLGGASYIGADNANSAAAKTEAYGGGTWASKADVINASFGSNPANPPSYDPSQNGQTVQALVNLRPNPSDANDKRGALFVKATGNEFNKVNQQRNCAVTGATPSQPMKGIISCETPTNDLEGLEQNVMMVGAVNANGQKSSYSNGGGVNWVMGLGGEFGGSGTYGEADNTGTDGPTIFSTDLRGCARGYSNDPATPGLPADYQAATDFLKGLTKTAQNVSENANCDYSYMNGTSAATPTVTGVVALMLSANPNLGWRDIREILAATAKPVDANYITRVMPNPNQNTKPNPFNLATRSFATQDDVSAAPVLGACINIGNGQAVDVPADGNTCAVLDIGTQTSGGQALEQAGSGDFNLSHSLWYGFGLVDAKRAVEVAKAYTSYLRTTITAADMPNFNPIDYVTEGTPPATLNYGKVNKLGTITVPAQVNIGQIQLRVSADQLCVGSVGFMLVQQGTNKRVVLSTPLNSYYFTAGGAAPRGVSNYTLGSYALYGQMVGPGNNAAFDVYAVATEPNANANQADSCGGAAMPSFNGVGTTSDDSGMKVEWRILPRVLDLKAGGTAGTGS